MAQTVKMYKDSLPLSPTHIKSFLDTSKKMMDTGFNSLKGSIRLVQIKLDSQFRKGKKTIEILANQGAHLNPDSLIRFKISRQEFNTQIDPYKNLLVLSGPLFHIDGGYLSYNYNYHSTTDTPYAEKNISQNMVNANLNFTIEKYLPFSANFYLSRSNSQYFRNITDLQIVFNTALFQSRFNNSLKELNRSMTESMNTGKIENAYENKKRQFLDLRSWLQNPFQLQKLIEAYETVNVPQKSFDPRLTDSLNSKRTDSLQTQARIFINQYQSEKAKIDQLEHEKDSLEQVYQHVKSLITRYKNMLNTGNLKTGVIDGIEDSLKRYGVKNSGVPEQFNWLMGVRNFAIGKASVNYTELTAKNISLSGINMEYNTWYYLAFCAGLIDYRFNDPVVNSANKVKQYMYMMRIGLGKVDNNHIILSFFQGKKQLFTAADSSGALASIPITGISLETQVKINTNSFLIAEVAQSFSPDFHFSPAKQNKGFQFSDYTDKAIAVKAYGYIPYTGTRLEGLYKFTGSNFQSFSSFQTNSSLKTWYIKADQYLLNRKLRISASVKTSDFTNPYIVQNYNGNTVFTSITASYRSRHFPSITIGYMPMSQLTAVGTQIMENKFETFTANITHYYKIGSIRASSTGVINKFFNSGSDTAFVFYNATNILIQQSFFFTDFTGSLNYSRSANLSYALNVVGEEINFPFSKRGSLGVGIKLNNFNQSENKIGEMFNLNYQIGVMDYLSITAERGYLPGTAGVLVHNDFGNLQFVKRF